MEIKIRLNKEHYPEAQMPFKKHKQDAGWDLFAATDAKYNYEYGFYYYDTGIHLEIPEGYVGLIYPRSSISKYDLRLCNAVGVIDSLYRGQIQFRFKPEEFPTVKKYEKGDRIGQLIVMPYPEITFKEVDELSNTERGQGGFGSTNQ